jgi:hypothetical protein
MIRRARLLAVLTILAVGALGVISSTQPWLYVILDDGAHDALVVPGAAAVPVLAPLSLAVLALGAALSIVGTVLRYVFGGLTLVIAGILALAVAPVTFAAPVAAITSTVTGATGISGTEAITALVSSISATPWPGITLAASIVLMAAGAFTLVTARSWTRSGRRYEAEATAEHADPAPASRPFDAIDSWDDLSRGSDPTTDSPADPPPGPR